MSELGGAMTGAMQAYLGASVTPSVEDSTALIRQIDKLSLADVTAILVCVASKLAHEPTARSVINNAQDSIDHYV